MTIFLKRYKLHNGAIRKKKLSLFNLFTESDHYSDEQINCFLPQILRVFKNLSFVRVMIPFKHTVRRCLLCLEDSKHNGKWPIKNPLIYVKMRNKEWVVWIKLYLRLIHEQRNGVMGSNENKYLLFGFKKIHKNI